MKVSKKLRAVLEEVVVTSENAADSLDCMLDHGAQAVLDLRRHSDKLMEFADELARWIKDNKEGD